MKRKEKDKKPGFPDFLKYRGNNLSGKEKNSFERELQKDPFAAEAEEGFSTVDPSALRNDMEELEKRMGSHTGSSKRFAWFRIAASVAVLMGLTTIFLLVQKNKPAEIASISDNKEVTFDIQQPEAIKDNTPITAIAQNKEKMPEEISPSKANKGYLTEGAVKMKTGKISVADSIERKADQMISIAEAEKAEAVVMELKMPVAARSMTKSRDMRMIRGKVLSSEDNLPIPGASIVVRGTTLGTVTDTGGNFELSVPEKTKPDMVANFIGMKSKEFNSAGDSVLRVTMDPDLTSLDEVVVVGYGISDNDKQVNENPTYTAAEPVNGRNAFNKYIEKNIVRPAPGTQKAVVVLSFTVKLSGEPENLKVVRSPGNLFSDEAIRLVTEGPKWKPATENGVNIEDEVRVRIVFK